MKKHLTTQIFVPKKFYTLLLSCRAENNIVVAMRRNLEIETMVDSLQPFSLQQYVVVSHTSVETMYTVFFRKKKAQILFFILTIKFQWQGWFDSIIEEITCGKLLPWCGKVWGSNKEEWKALYDNLTRREWKRAYEHAFETSFKIQISCQQI